MKPYSYKHVGMPVGSRSTVYTIPQIQTCRIFRRNTITYFEIIITHSKGMSRPEVLKLSFFKLIAELFYQYVGNYLEFIVWSFQLSFNQKFLNT